MNLFKLKTNWTNGELYIFKLGVFAAGILVGVYVKQFILPYLGWFWLLAIAGCVSAGYFWVSKSKK
jgi:hypothetical protein